MITEDEKEMLVNEITERMLLKIPEIVGSLIINYSEKIRVNKEFYEKYKEFNNHRDIVASVIEDMENKGSFKPFKEIVNDAVPVIKRRIDQLKGIDTKTVKTPNLDFSQGEF